MSISTMPAAEPSISGLSRFRDSLTRGFTHSVSGFDSEHRVTMGIVLGMLAGLMPKDSLLAYVFIGLLVLSLANMLAGVVSLIVFSYVGPLLDQWSDSLGYSVLTQPALQNVLAGMMQMPLLPWMRLDNTVVMGNFLIGLALVYPMYWIGFRCYSRIKPNLIRWFAANRSTRWLVRNIG